MDETSYCWFSLRVGLLVGRPFFQLCQFLTAIIYGRPVLQKHSESKTNFLLKKKDFILEDEKIECIVRSEIVSQLNLTEAVFLVF
jgi:hypothetical protein